MSAPSEEPRLHVDSDWKAQAQAEKERLARLDQERSQKSGGRPPGDLPPADFRSLVGMLASQAMSGLGLYGDEKGRVIVDPMGSKFAIDLLGVLQEKTRGNLSTEEASDLEAVLRELRLRFVQVIDLLARQDVRVGAAGVQGPTGAQASADAPGGSGSAAESGALRGTPAGRSDGAPRGGGASAAPGASPEPKGPGGGSAGASSSRIIVP